MEVIELFKYLLKEKGYRIYTDRWGDSIALYVYTGDGPLIHQGMLFIWGGMLKYRPYQNPEVAWDINNPNFNPQEILGEIARTKTRSEDHHG